MTTVRKFLGNKLLRFYMATEELNCLKRCFPSQLEKQFRAKKTPDRKGPEHYKMK
jgi:hypothetical protein